MRHLHTSFAAFALFSATAMSTPSASAAELVIGELHPITGQASYYGIPMSRGMQLAIKQINDQGGLKIGDETYQVRLETGDDQATGVAGVAATRKLIANSVKYIIGPQSSPVASAVAPIMKSADVVQIIDGSTAENIVNNVNTFRTTVTAGTYDDAVVKIADIRKSQTIAFLTNRLAAGFMVTEKDLVAKLEKGSHKVVSQSYFKVGDTDFSAQITQIMQLKPDALFLRDAPVEDALITKQARQLGYKGDIVWEVNAPATTVVKNITDEDMNGVYNGIPPKTDYFVDRKTPAAMALREAYKAMFNADLGENSAISYDSANLLFVALQKAKSTDPKAVAEALKTVKVSEIPRLVTEFVPQKDGLLFEEGQAKLPTLAQVWKDGAWHLVN
ncbi:ABC transporter substrate-binding protein [Neorhizobium alkalisoli]|uniref:Amino acid/amide ABC transporter substrate-binding protein (HAAT family) n=1 Tax=Neorhizobium alkalisoli TaxID=528178 RepID=A0A561Q7X8_9HYPH|nr:ABC transporter substrate-binding protein [Neorhizobium alkalisoli]TWF46494.1 amino acid/amide ABC transporter substrate-binding protein (HAAT family) [Neorhizobium alkalisoli]